MEHVLTVGQLSKQCKVSIRTIQYYDKINLLKPRQKLKSGKRLYDERDIAMLHQIIILKSYGLSLKEIKERLVPMDHDNAIINLLNQQAFMIEKKISMEKKQLESIKMLKRNIEESKEIDWSKYTQMLELINEDSENYWVVNFLEEDLLKKMTEVHDHKGSLSINWLSKLLNDTKYLQEQGYKPCSDEASVIGQKWWEFIEIYTNGDLKLIGQLRRFYESAKDWPEELSQLHKEVNDYFEACIECFLKKNQIILDER